MANPVLGHTASPCSEIKVQWPITFFCVVNFAFFVCIVKSVSPSSTSSYFWENACIEFVICCCFCSANVSVPVLQSFPFYVLLWLVYTPIHIHRRFSQSTRPTLNNDDTHASDTVSSQAPTHNKSVFTLNISWWKYALITLADVEGNFFVVLAFQYTSLTSVSLLTASTVIFVAILSRWFLCTRYRIWHILAMAGCISGLAILVCSDILIYGDETSGKDSYECAVFCFSAMAGCVSGRRFWLRSILYAKSRCFEKRGTLRLLLRVQDN